MVKPRFSVFDAVFYGIKTLLDNIRLFVFAFLVKFAVFVGCFSLLGVLGAYLIRSLWDLRPQFEAFFTCSTYDMCRDIFSAKLWPVLSPLLSQYMAFFVLWFAIIVFIGLGIYLGFIRMVLTLFDTGKSSVRLLFSSFHLVPNAFIAGIIYAIFVAVGLVFFIVPGIYFAIRFAFFPYFIVDKNAGIIDSLERSLLITKKQTWPVFGVILALIPLIQLPGGLGLFATAPIVTAALIYAYRKLSA